MEGVETSYAITQDIPKNLDSSLPGIIVIVYYGVLQVRCFRFDFLGLYVLLSQKLSQFGYISE